MKTDRIISYSCTLAAAASIALPASAQAGSVLSGYGGPGQGNQAVLGSALIGGPRGGGSGGSGSTGSSSEGSSPRESGSAPESGSASATNGQGAGAGGQAGGRPGADARDSRGGADRRGGSARARTGAQVHPIVGARGLYPAAEHVPAGGEGTVFGLTGDELLYIVLAVAILALVGGLTRRLGDSPSGAPTGD